MTARHRWPTASLTKRVAQQVAGLVGAAGGKEGALALGDALLRTEAAANRCRVRRLPRRCVYSWRTLASLRAGPSPGVHVLCVLLWRGRGLRWARVAAACSALQPLPVWFGLRREARSQLASRLLVNAQSHHRGEMESGGDGVPVLAKASVGCGRSLGLLGALQGVGLAKLELLGGELRAVAKSAENAVPEG